jgi:SAM-dependent methyltransferase
MSLRDHAIALAKKYVSPEFRNWVVRMQRRYRLQWPRMGSVDFGNFYRITPISPIFGIDRGLPIERYYIEKFLGKHSDDIRGHCLELGDPYYIKKFGGDRVTKIDVLHYVEGNPLATIVADLTRADHIPADTFDCIIFTQTLQMIYDMKAGLRHLYRILKPNGVLLLTSHGITKIGRQLGRDDWGEYWHITTQSAAKLFEETFPDADVAVGSYGNVLTAICALHGIASDEIDKKELDYLDPDFEVIVTVRAVKLANSNAADR